MTDFTDIMRQRTDSELLEITTTLRESYQPEAVVAAETELISRNLTDQQFADAQQLLDNKKQEEENKNEKLKIIKNKTAELTDTFNPLTEKTTDKTIKVVTIGLTIAFIMYVINNWDLTILMLQDIGKADISSFEYFAPLILFPIGLFGFWKTKKYGWFILTILFTYLTMTTLIAMGLEIKWAVRTPMQSDSSGLGLLMDEIENYANEQFFNSKGFAYYIGKLILFAGLLFFLNRHTITEKYLISKRTQLLVFGLTAIPFILFGLTILT